MGGDSKSVSRHSRQTDLEIRNPARVGLMDRRAEDGFITQLLDILAL
jgi:hypothetical protein